MGRHAPTPWSSDRLWAIGTPTSGLTCLFIECHGTVLGYLTAYHSARNYRVVLGFMPNSRPRTHYPAPIGRCQRDPMIIARLYHPSVHYSIRASSRVTRRISLAVSPSRHWGFVVR